MSINSKRYAIYFTPSPNCPLAYFGAAVLGYDSYRGEVVEQVALPRIDSDEMAVLTSEPRRYGFHATLKAPFRLKQGADLRELETVIAEFAATRTAVPLGDLAVDCIGNFIALVPRVQTADLLLLAAECVALFDGFRAPLSEPERERRSTSTVTPRKAYLFEQWGYPYVFEQFRLHMTLSNPLSDDSLRFRLKEALSIYFATYSPAITIDAVTLMEQSHPQKLFKVRSRFQLKG